MTTAYYKKSDERWTLEELSTIRKKNGNYLFKRDKGETIMSRKYIYQKSDDGQMYPWFEQDVSDISNFIEFDGQDTMPTIEDIDNMIENM